MDYRHENGLAGPKKIALIVPSHLSEFSGLYQNVKDIYKGILKNNLESKIFIVNTGIKNNIDEIFKGYSFEVIDKSDIIHINKETDAIFHADDHSLVRILNRMNYNTLFSITWVIYLFGQEIWVEGIKKLRRENAGFSLENLRGYLIDFVPRKLMDYFIGWYAGYLRKQYVLAVSSWAANVLEKILGIPTRGIMYTPVDTDFYPFVPPSKKDSRILIFLGSKRDTDIILLTKVLEIIKRINPSLGLDTFGSEELYVKLKEKVPLTYLGKLTRQELGKEYGRHLITIAPQFDGTFEMVPIESLLTGTPVITYMNSLIEVVKCDHMVLNIENIELLEKYLRFLTKSEDMDVVSRELREKIAEHVDVKRNAQQLINNYIPHFLTVKGTNITK
ncbi:hypothetical protein HS1genome_1884 [Sulfodiicoccus acidiphilus]|uniref:Glycosyl transferase family 1 domain-containing protein n=1 Tax=Sulfodiicoccus acidiphilus TaxID=1670455 RepID=A0A348B5P3_9CREN|nr:glycosyltransferase family 4 protein [Sulfodiicoccus acidiphilus]BBD73495.1 hypothetical protein HS1genome_1884 [Sulfodiicoccus acidiphilus]GGT92753.1 hypothetical protein GCM10007116_08160 [Sulfodiicoccus acidiphilus]